MADGGAKGVRGRVQEFNDFLCDQITYLTPELHRQGDYTVVLAGDSVSVLCEDFDQAVGIGIHLFTQAFYDTKKRELPFWFRGSIAGWHNQSLTVNTNNIIAGGLHVGTQYKNEDDYLDVLALEKSGYKGMRLVIDRKLLDSKGAQYKRSWPTQGKGSDLGIITRLVECPYPSGGDYADILWMADTEPHYHKLRDIMASRFKKATRGS